MGTRIDKKKKHRKHKFLYNLLDEMWDTQNQTSLTSKNVVEFTENVLEHAENFRSTRLFPVKKSRRMVYPSKLLETLEYSKNEKKEIIGKKRLTHKELFEKKKRQKIFFIKKVLTKMKKFQNKTGIGFVKQKGKFHRINLIKLAQAKILLEDAKKRRKVLKKSNKKTTLKKKNSLDLFLYSIFMKAKQTKKLKYFTFNRALFSKLREKKQLILSYYFKKKGKKKGFRKIGGYYRKTKYGFYRRRFYLRNEQFSSLRLRPKKTQLIKKVARVMTNNTKTKKIK